MIPLLLSPTELFVLPQNIYGFRDLEAVEPAATITIGPE
jgi:hypothetical protein